MRKVICILIVLSIMLLFLPEFKQPDLSLPNESVIDGTPPHNEIDRVPHGTRSPGDIIVDINGNGDYTEIQDGINASVDGDNIYVWNGNYTENVLVNKTVSLIGNGSSLVTVQNAEVLTYCIRVTSSWANVTGFNTTGGEEGIYISSSITNIDLANNTAHGHSKYGIRIASASYCNLTNNTMYNNKYNFFLTGYSDSQFNHTIDQTNTVNGKAIIYKVGVSDYKVPINAGFVGMIFCENITVENLTLSNNKYGVFFYKTNNSTVSNIYVTACDDGIMLDTDCKNNVLTNNIIDDNAYGIAIHDGTTNTTVKNNTLYDNGRGVSGFIADNCTIMNNTMYDHTYGIYLESSSKNHIIKDNTISSSLMAGIYLKTSSINNLIYHNNLMNNALLEGDQVYDSDPANNSWNHTYPIGGNHWHNYTGQDNGSGPDNHSIAGDGIGDTDFPHPYTYFDNYPFLYKDGWKIYDILLIEDYWNFKGYPNVTSIKSSTLYTRIPNCTAIVGKNITTEYWYTYWPSVGLIEDWDVDFGNALFILVDINVTWQVRGYSSSTNITKDKWNAEVFTNSTIRSIPEIYPIVSNCTAIVGKHDTSGYWYTYWPSVGLTESWNIEFGDGLFILTTEDSSWNHT